VIQLITFDLDNTLWEVTPVIVQAEKKLRAWLTERIPHYAEVATGEQMAEWRNAALARDPHLRYYISKLRIELLEQAISSCGESPARARDLAREAFAIFMQGRNDVAFYPDALSTLQTIAERYRLAALTNGNADISVMPISATFEFSMSPDQIGSRKPEPAIFEATLERAGCHSGEVIHVGDNLAEDIDGAAASGWRSIWVNLAQEDEPDVRNYNAMVTELAALPAAIERLNGG